MWPGHFLHQDAVADDRTTNEVTRNEIRNDDPNFETAFHIIETAFHIRSCRRHMFASIVVVVVYVVAVVTSVFVETGSAFRDSCDAAAAAQIKYFVQQSDSVDYTCPPSDDDS